MENPTPKKFPVGLAVGIAAAALATALVGGYFGLCSWVQTNGRLLPGAVAVDDKGETVADLGGLTEEEALAIVSQEMNQRLDSRKLILLYGEGKRKELSGELMDCSPETVVRLGAAAKRDTPFWKLGALWLGAVQKTDELSLSATAFTPQGEAEAKKVIQSIADEMYLAPVDFTYELGEEEVTVTPGFDGRQMDAPAILEAVEQALAQGQAELRVEPEVVPGAELSGKTLNDLIHVEPKPAGVDEDGKLTPAVIGLSVNPDEAQAILDQATPGEPVTIPLEFTPPGTSGDESLYYHDLLAEVTTNLDGVANRSFNVARAAASCNGVVLQPGDVFSYIGAIGDPSSANGYKPSTGYQDGRTVPMDGGGVCQVSSSLYYCAVYSNLEIVRRACHAFSTGYIPNGLDATIYYPSLDFKFRNNTGFPIKIVAYCEGGAWGKLTVQFFGSNPDNISVKTERYALSSTPWTTVYTPDESIPVGEQKVDVTPYTGYEVDVYRCVYDGDGQLISRTFENHSKYAKRDKVILYNPADAASLGLPPVEPGVDPNLPPVDPTVDPIVTPEPSVPPEPPAATPEPTADVPPDPNQGPLPGGVPSTEPGNQPDPPVDVTPEPTPTPYVDPSFDEEPPSWLFGRLGAREG